MSHRPPPAHRTRENIRLWDHLLHSHLDIWAGHRENPAADVEQCGQLPPITCIGRVAPTQVADDG